MPEMMPKSKSTYEYVGSGYPPVRAYANDAGMDLICQEDRVIYPGETEYIPSGVRFFLEPGEAVNIMTRSSTFRKRVTVVPTIIDTGYRDVASIIVSNFNTYPVTVKAGDRLAQAVLIKVMGFANEEYNEIDRASRGLGSSDEIYS